MKLNITVHHGCYEVSYIYHCSFYTHLELCIIASCPGVRSRAILFSNCFMWLWENHLYRKYLLTGEQAILRAVKEGVDCARFLLTSYWASCCDDAPTNHLPTTHLIPTKKVALRVSGGGRPGHNCSTSWRQWTSWWVCPITHETTECLCNYLPLVLVNCCHNSTPVEGTMVDVRDIVTSMMHCDVKFHLVFIYIGWIVHHCQLSWCSKQSNLILELFHVAVGESFVSKAPP